MGIKNVFQAIEKVKIGGFAFNLRPVVEDQEMGTRNAAEINYRAENISYVADRATKGESILHECIHAICDKPRMFPAEELVGELSFGLHALMRDNPELIIQILRENNEDQVDRIILDIIKRSGNKYPEEAHAKAEKKPA